MKIIKFPEVYRYTFDDFLADKWPQGHPLQPEYNENNLAILQTNLVWVRKKEWSFWVLTHMFPDWETPAVRIRPYGRYSIRSYLLPVGILRDRFLIFQDFQAEYAQLEQKRANYLFANSQDQISPRASSAFTSSPPKAPPVFSV